MDIVFESARIQRVLTNSKRARGKYGPKGAERLMRRLDELRAAETLEDMRYLPQARCHELRGNLKGILSVDAQHPLRLLFRPASNPVPKTPDGGLDWAGVTTIEILGVEDTHG